MAHTRYSVLLFVFLGLVGSSHARSIVPLKEAREKLELPKYTPDEQELLAKEMDVVLRQLFVHRTLKVQHFGKTADPLPKLEKLVTEAKTLTPATFHQTASRIFTDLHDLHTNYIGPRPLSCGLAFAPLRFERVREEEKELIVVSQKLEILPQLTEGIEIQDELLEVNGKSVKDTLGTLEKVSGGSNPDAMKYRAIQLITFRQLALQAAPSEDVLKLKFSGNDGEYEKEIPWHVLLDDECVENPNHTLVLPLKTPLSEAMNLAEDDFQKKYNRLFGTPSLVAPSDRWAAPNPLSDIFEVTTLNTPAGTIGYLKIKAFYWSNKSLDTGTVIEGIRRAIEETLAPAVGLVIDVRGNPGGLIVFAEKLVQLFSRREVQPTTVRMLANPLNEEIFVKANGKDNRWSLAIHDAIEAGKTYTPPMAITPTAEANSIGQIWFRPVVVLTDAACYSACDLFAAGMKDNDAAAIIGLHQTTGGGGANVMEYNTFRMIMESGTNTAPNPFAPLPYNQNMRVAWRQTLRAGNAIGEYIEDKGVESQVVIPLKKADVGAESKELMKAIHKYIDELQPKFTSGMSTRRAGLVLLKNQSQAEWKESVFGVDSIDYYLDGENVGSIEVPLTEKPAEVALSVESLTGNWHDQPVLLIGKRNGKRMFRTVRELKWRGDYSEISTDGLKVDFEKPEMDPIKAVLLKGPKNSGWQTVDGTFRVGKGPQYQPRVLARAFAPLALKKLGGSFTFDLKLNAESLNDSLRLYYFNPDTGERKDIFAGSQVRPLVGVSIPMPKEWERADVVMEFESDENWNLEGPVFDNIQFKQ